VDWPIEYTDPQFLELRGGDNLYLLDVWEFVPILGSETVPIKTILQVCGLEQKKHSISEGSPMTMVDQKGDEGG